MEDKLSSSMAAAYPTNNPLDNEPNEDSEKFNKGVGLCLSGGGYRAMVFHVGVLWRFFEANLLPTLTRISSVSGGSITAAQLALAWPSLVKPGATLRDDFIPGIVAPIRKLAGITLDRKAIAVGAVLFEHISDHIEAAYDDVLFKKKTLQDLPNEPRFVINATNAQSGALWRFSRPYMGDYRVGLINDPTVGLAKAVAASSAFPPVLSPALLDVDPNSFDPKCRYELYRDPYNQRIVLSDGGVYDNMALETVWKSHYTVFVSDGGAKIADEEEPHEDWPRHMLRVLDVIDNQVRSLRKRQLIRSYQDGDRKGAYWSIRGNIADYGGDPTKYPVAKTAKLAAIPTRLKRLSDEDQKGLINWGYVICDASLRKNYGFQGPFTLPY